MMCLKSHVIASDEVINFDFESPLSFGQDVHVQLTKLFAYETVPNNEVGISMGVRGRAALKKRIEKLFDPSKNTTPTSLVNRFKTDKLRSFLPWRTELPNFSYDEDERRFIISFGPYQGYFADSPLLFAVMGFAGQIETQSFPEFPRKKMYGIRNMTRVSFTVKGTPLPNDDLLSLFLELCGIREEEDMDQNMETDGEEQDEDDVRSRRGLKRTPPPQKKKKEPEPVRGGEEEVGTGESLGRGERRRPSPNLTQEVETSAPPPPPRESVGGTVSRRGGRGRTGQRPALPPPPAGGSVPQRRRPSPNLLEVPSAPNPSAESRPSSGEEEEESEDDSPRDPDQEESRTAEDMEVEETMQMENEKEKLKIMAKLPNFPYISRDLLYSWRLLYEAKGKVGLAEEFPKFEGLFVRMPGVLGSDVAQTNLWVEDVDDPEKVGRQLQAALKELSSVLGLNERLFEVLVGQSPLTQASSAGETSESSSNPQESPAAPGNSLAIRNAICMPGIKPGTAGTDSGLATSVQALLSTAKASGSTEKVWISFSAEAAKLLRMPRGEYVFEYAPVKGLLRGAPFVPYGNAKYTNLLGGKAPLIVALQSNAYEAPTSFIAGRGQSYAVGYAEAGGGVSASEPFVLRGQTRSMTLRLYRNDLLPHKFESEATVFAHLKVQNANRKRRRGHQQED